MMKLNLCLRLLRLLAEGKKDETQLACTCCLKVKRMKRNMRLRLWCRPAAGKVDENATCVCLSCLLADGERIKLGARLAFRLLRVLAAGKEDEAQLMV